jgi:NlpC/P60 family
VLCAVVPGDLAAQQNIKSSEPDRQTVLKSEVIGRGLVNSDQGMVIIGAALESRHTDANADCSDLVHEIYARAGFAYSYANSSELYRGTKEFRRVTHPQPGDLAVWRGHVGIVISPVQHSFFSAMRSGRGVEFYDSPYWQARGRPRFFRYLKAVSSTQLSALARNANLKPGSSRNAESYDPSPAGEDSGVSQGITSAQPVTSTGTPGGNGDEPARGSVRAGTVAPPEASGANSPATLSTDDGAQESSHHKSESETTPDALSAMDRNKTPSSRYKIQGPGDGVWEKAATKPSAGIPFDSVATATRPYEPRRRQGFGTSNIAAKVGHAGARPPSAGGPLVTESRSEPVQWAMSRYVPRPPWSSSSGRTSEPSVPRPPAGRVPRANPRVRPTRLTGSVAPDVRPGNIDLDRQ